ncbi:putative MFS family arabinose efflux permease [Prauserella isguenensis]|uniref:Putative MFS family arabinose efflux permease n=1 Tax=Prauserella isguenensis TaxID=1470180 RepID=A0A839S7Z3_9PSEU|nr:YbfB/YjiJ family MFS transporter [Prauserella isguenensis]MBB3053393.1 putative MFS family arabinose efflux permease [Prauserella isguenensis]
MNIETLHTPAHGTSPWTIVARAAAALAAAMGVGRFAFTPILPLMEDQAEMSADLGASLATANYVGYLAGALVGIVAPAVARSVMLLRGSLLVLTASTALMPVLTGATAWSALRLTAGTAGAVVFVITVGAAMSQLRDHANHVTGWVFGGVGAGITLSATLVLIAGSVGTWQDAWWTCAALTALLTAVAWRLTPEQEAASSHGDPAGRHTHRWFAPLLVSYTLEGVGYIIAGTFLVAAIEHSTPGALGAGAWILVGLAAVPSCAVWAGLSRRWSRPTLLVTALTVQAVGIALPAVFPGAAGALVSAVLFGVTFMGITTVTLAIGRQLHVPRAVAMLTTGYSAGQILGPVLSGPLLHRGYDDVLVLGSAFVFAAGVAAAAVRVRFPHRLAT